MRIKLREIEIILDGLREEKANSRSFAETIKLIRLEEEWEAHWYTICEREEDEVLLDWMEGI